MTSWKWKNNIYSLQNVPQEMFHEKRGAKPTWRRLQLRGKGRHFTRKKGAGEQTKSAFLIPEIKKRSKANLTPMWSGQGESNPHDQLGKLEFYH